MLINNKVRKIENYLKLFKEGDNIRIGVAFDDEIAKIAQKIGFSKEFIIGESVIPNAKISREAFENSEGKCIIRKDLPLEQAERYWEWSWKDWHDNEYTDFKYIPYYRYKREYLTPKAFSLSIEKDTEDNVWIVSPVVKVSFDYYDDIKLLVNLFVSIFKKCELIDSKLNSILTTSVKRLDWEILRTGKNLNSQLDLIIERHIPERKRNMYRRNFSTLQENKPDTIAIGRNGFSGYVCFSYSRLGIAVLESLMPNNATYILNEDWQEISKLTKTEVLSNELYRERIYHYQSWKDHIIKHLKIVA